VVLSGYFNYNIDFGTGVLTSDGGATYDGFLAAIGP
jgi:hypothetical protein